MNEEDLCFTPATELARMVAARELSPVEIVDTVLARIERLEPRINAFATLTADRARDAAGRPRRRSCRARRSAPCTACR